jgi:hypothetical protein
MDNPTFNALIRASRNGDNGAGTAAGELLRIVRRKVGFYLVGRGQKPNADIIDDVTGIVILRLYEKKVVPKRYAWKLWIHFLTKGAWAEYCRDNFSERDVSFTNAPMELLDMREHSIPVPTAANARLLESDGVEILKRKALDYAPDDSDMFDVFEWAVSMLVEMGTVLTPEMAALRSGLPQDSARQTIIQAVLAVRETFEELFGDEGIHAIEECNAARTLAESIF